VAAVDMQPGAVVLEHGSNGRGVPDRVDQVVVVLLARRGCVGVIPGERVGDDDPLSLRRGKEEPMPPQFGEPRIGTFQGLDDRHSVKDDESPDLVAFV
jgi:hypothetical protein